MNTDKKIKVEVPDDLKAVEEVIFKTIAKLAPATRLYPDEYASVVAQALAKAGLVVRTEETP